MTQESFIAKNASAAFPRWVWGCDYRVVNRSNMMEAFKEIASAPRVSWDSEFEFQHVGHDVHAYQFSTRPQSGWLIPVAMDHITNLPDEITQRFLRAISLKENIVQNQEAERRSVYAHFPDLFTRLCNITHDIQVLWFQRDPNNSKDFKEGRPKGSGRGGAPQGFSLTAMARQYLRIEVPDLHTYFNEGNKFRELDYHSARLYGCCDTDVTLRLFELGKDPAILDSFIYKLDTRLLEVLQFLEDTGVMIDLDVLEKTKIELADVVADARTTVYKLMRMDPATNVDSATQLSRHVTNVLQWPPVTRISRKDKLISVDKMARERWMESPDPSIAEAARALHDYKSLETLLTKFVSKFDQYVNPVTGAIHCSFPSTIVPTGRLASAGPNLQNVPKKRKDGRAPLRRAFRARPGKVFLEADYSQIELRVLAGESQEPFLLEAYLNDEDLHYKTAVAIYSKDDIDDDQRQVGKMINFGLVYQMEASGLASRTDLTTEQAQRFLDDYFSAMPQATAWIRKVIADAKQMGGVRTHFGRWRPLAQWLNSRNPSEVSFGERSAINTIVQGTAADIMKIALLRLYSAIKQGTLDASILLTVHDSVLFELPEHLMDPEHLPGVLKVINDCMCFPVEGYPGLKIDLKTGPNWYDLHKLEEDDPEVAPLAEQDKLIPLPSLTDEQLARLLKLIKATSPGHLNVQFANASGTTLPVIKMDGAGYQRVLAYIVSIAREKRAKTTTESQEQDVPAVTFA